MAIRKNIRHLSDAERGELVAALHALKGEVGEDGVSTYDRHTRWHMVAMARATDPPRPWWEHNQAHRGPAFLPWHRMFLRSLELELERVSGNPELGIPYWDWTQDAADPVSAPVWAEDLLGGDGDRTDNDRITSGPFADPEVWTTVRARFDGDDQLAGFEPGGTLRRRFNPGLGVPTQAEVDGLLAPTPYDTVPWDATSAGSFRNLLEGWRGPGLHNQVHGFVGGDMTQGTSPNDPVFYLHHSSVDRLWGIWQERFPNSPYLPAGDAPDGHNLQDPMFPWDGEVTPRVVTPEAMLSPGVVVYA